MLGSIWGLAMIGIHAEIESAFTINSLRVCFCLSGLEQLIQPLCFRRTEDISVGPG